MENKFIMVSVVETNHLITKAPNVSVDAKTKLSGDEEAYAWYTHQEWPTLWPISIPDLLNGRTTPCKPPELGEIRISEVGASEGFYQLTQKTGRKPELGSYRRRGRARTLVFTL